jgi:hypothetical protein
VNPDDAHAGQNTLFDPREAMAARFDAEDRAAAHAEPASDLDYLCVPLRARGGETRGLALVDRCDAAVVMAHWWFLNLDGYAFRSSKSGHINRKVLMHRELLGLETGDPRHADHINGRRLDNRRSNLRIVTQADNNRLYRRISGVSRFRGVYRRKDCDRWAARATFNYRKFWLGSFRVEEDAAEAVNDFWVMRGYDPPNGAPLRDAEVDREHEGRA